MDEGSLLSLLRLLLLVTDGVGIFASYTVAQYYRPRKDEAAVLLLYVFFYALTVVFVALTISDVLVIARVPQTWATLPIVRGLIFRFPLAIIELWMIHRQHVH
jgi:membrane-associated HD superfamily phosphohydrolase